MSKPMTEPTKEEMLDWFDGYGKDEYRPRCPMRSGPYNEEMRQAIRRLILASDKGPEVDEKWIEQKIKYIAEHPSYHRLEVVLREAGVWVKETADES